MVAVTKKPLINPNLVTLKCVLLTFFGGLGCIFPFLPGHMRAIGLNADESRWIQVIASAVSIIGPIVAFFLADRWIAIKKTTNYGAYLRVITAIFMILAAILYGLMLLVPRVVRIPQHQPRVSFSCDSEGGLIFQQRCTEEKLCHKWDDIQRGWLQLANCTYACQAPENITDMYQPWIWTQQPQKERLIQQPVSAPLVEYSQELDYVEDDSSDRSRRQVERIKERPNPPPHVCITEENKPVVCHAYTPGTEIIKVRAELNSAVDVENDTYSADWCRYPINNYQCHIPDAQVDLMKRAEPDCKPAVECHIINPYENEHSVLANSLCIKIIGDVETTVFSYSTLRILADIFPLAVIVLLDTAILIATRETSTGRGDVGHQLAWGSFGWAIFAPIATLISFSFELPPAETNHDYTNPYYLQFGFGVVLIFISALILLFSTKMPLTPPEWWWHTKIGMLAIPMSAIRKYGPEIFGLFIVSILLGGFWAAVDQYQWWHLFELLKPRDIPDYNANIHGLEADLITALSNLVFAIPTILAMWYAERIVDFCGHSNVLITAFCTYIVRYIGLAANSDPYLVLIFELLELITLGLSWVTLVLYMRYLVPRKWIAFGQAIPVIGHFCLGRLIGSLIGFRQDYSTSTSLLGSFICTYRALACAAAICAIIYFVLYTFWLAPKCIPPTQPPPSEAIHSPLSNGTNGTYTPLRVYHDSKAKKGHFRY